MKEQQTTSKICRDYTLDMVIVDVYVTKLFKTKKQIPWYGIDLTVRNDEFGNVIYRMNYYKGVEVPECRMKFIENEGLTERSARMLDDFPAFDMMEKLLRIYQDNPEDSEKIQAITDSWIDNTLGDFVDGDIEKFV